MTSLQKAYVAEFAILEELFGVDRVSSSIERLNEIHRFVETTWRQYVARIPDGVVRYLLIAEAPPWTRTGTPRFVLHPNSPQSALMRALRRTFLDDDQLARLNTAQTLAEFARQGLLIVDSIPFSMKYLSRHRAKPQYRELVAKSVQTYLNRKLVWPAISWSPGIRVALAFRLNAHAVIAALDGQLKLGHIERTLGPELIAANDSGFPDARTLRSIYGLS